MQNKFKLIVERWYAEFRAECEGEEGKITRAKQNYSVPPFTVHSVPFHRDRYRFLFFAFSSVALDVGLL